MLLLWITIITIRKVSNDTNFEVKFSSVYMKTSANGTAMKWPDMLVLYRLKNENLVQTTRFFSIYGTNVNSFILLTCIYSLVSLIFG